MDWTTTKLNLRYHWKTGALWGVALSVLLLLAGVGRAATLEIPGPNTTLSGVGVISGWKCDAGELTIVFNDDGKHIPLLYGSERTDVRTNGQCLDNAHDNVGFVAIWNWGELGDGQHTAVAYDDGVEFDRATFRVVTPGTSFLRGAAGTGTATLNNGQEATLVWSEASQSFVVTEWTATPESPTNTLGISYRIGDDWDGVPESKLLEHLDPAFRLLVGAFGLAAPPYRLFITHSQGNPYIEVGSYLEEKAHFIGLPMYGDRNEYYVANVHAFSHELAHSLMNFDLAASRQHEWFEETLAEMAAQFVLRAFATNPPYPLPLIVDGYEFDLNLWQSHVEGLDCAMTSDLMQNWGLAPQDPVVVWFPASLNALESDPTIRELNWAIGNELLPHFQANPTLWRACAYLNLWETSEDRTFREYLDSWEAILRVAGEETTLISIVRKILYGA